MISITRGRSSVALVASLAVAVATVVLPSSGIADERYDLAMAQSLEFERNGEILEAIDALRSLPDDYSQDFALSLRLGWLLFQTQDYEESARYYSRALELNPDSPDALLGLGWCDYRLGDYDSASERFRLVLSARADDASAAQGLELSTRRSVMVWAQFFSVAYRRHPDKKAVIGGSVAGTIGLTHGWSVSGLYRGSFHDNPSKTGTPGNWLKQGFGQHEGFVGVEHLGHGWKAAARYALLSNDSGALETTHALGLSGSLEAWGTLSADASLSIYDDGEAWRLGVQYSMPIASWFFLTPGASAQLVLEHPRWSAMLAVGGSAWRLGWNLGARFGDEERPAYMDMMLVYNSPDRLKVGAWANLEIDIGYGIGLAGAFEYRSLGSGESKGGGSSSMNTYLMVLSWKE